MFARCASFIGLRNSFVDLWIHGTSLLYRSSARRRRFLGLWRRPAEPPKPTDWRSVLLAGYAEPQYQSGDQVLYQGLPYQAKWSNQGVSPATAAGDPSGSAWKALYSVPGEPSGTPASPRGHYRLALPRLRAFSGDQQRAGQPADA
ncbi:MAG TPA: hypothetical protein VGG83_17000 [Trebonia sp.]